MSNQSRVLLAVGGGIAAYKSADLCSKMSQAGFDVRVLMTVSALQFVGDATMAALSGHPVLFKSFDPDYPLGAHIELPRDVDAMVIAPATANLIGKMANGIADDLVTTTYLQNASPVLVAPAMSDAMWRSPAVARNLDTLRQDGCHLIGPETGWLSCRAQGTGRMSEPAKILEYVRTVLSPPGTAVC